MHGKYLSNIWQFYLTIKFHGTINDPLVVLPGNEQYIKIGKVKTYLFDKVCKVNGIICFGDQSANTEKS